MSIFEEIAKKLSRSGSKPADAPLEQITSAVDQSPDEQKLIAYVKEKIDTSRQSNSRIAMESIYMTNVAYMLGFDGVVYDATYRTFKNNDPKRKLTRSRVKINKILPTIQNRLARVTQSPPKYDVRPNSNNTSDKDAARLGIDILNDVFDKNNFEEKRQDLHLSSMQGGVSYVQAVWDSMLGKPMIDPDTQEFQGYEGDVRLEIMNCLEVFPDPLAKNLDDAQWWIKAKVRKLDYFRDRYPDRGEAVKEEGTWLLSSLYDLKANALSSVGIVGSQTTEQSKNSAIEIVYHEKRSKDYPKGRKIVIASGILLEDKELPIGEFDLVKFDDILVGGRYNSEAIITHLRPVQDQYNILRTKMADWIKKMLAGKYAAPRGANLGQEALSDESGEVVEYDPVINAPNGGQPIPMVVPQIPSYAYEDIKVLEQEFDFISGINEVSRGVSPGASMPFRGMALLQESDQTRISVQTKRNEVGYARLGSIILKYVAANYQMPRMLKTAGELGYAVKEFMGDDLGGNTDVIVIAGSTVPTSKVLKRQDIMNTYQMGLLGDPADPKLRQKVLSMMEYGDVAEMWKTQALDMAMIKKCLENIEQGEMPQLHEWDNHGLFVQEMNDYRKTDKYSELDTKGQAMFNYVIEWHVQALISLTQPQIAQNQMMAEHMVNTMTNMFGQGQGPSGPQPGMAGPGIPQGQPPQNNLMPNQQGA